MGIVDCSREVGNETVFPAALMGSLGREGMLFRGLRAQRERDSPWAGHPGGDDDDIDEWSTGHLG